MLYQLPNGKVINISMEDYFNLTDEDIQYLISVDAGEHLSTFHSSSIKKSSTRSVIANTVDYDRENEENQSSNMMMANDYELEDFSDLQV